MPQNETETVADKEEAVEIIGNMQSGNKTTALAQYISTTMGGKMKEGETQEGRARTTRLKTEQIQMLYAIGEHISNKTHPDVLKEQLLAASNT